MIVTKNEPGLEQLNIVRSLAERSGISFALAKILWSRGVNTVNKVKRFLSPGKEYFTSPFLFKGMEEAVSRIEQAKGLGETVVIYGDYDADGVCATTVLYYALKEYGMENVFPVLPEREDGYGLSEELIDKVMEEYNPDLIITVDCGISGYKEVDYIKDLGVDVIVTDHHELPEILPDCVTINCKFQDQEYEFDSLCGAGVAFKLATALIGKNAYGYLDLVALATVADSMPLVDENRDIVYEGLKILKSRSVRTAFKELISAAKLKEINSTSLAYTIAPRINAAGRMGNAACALRLFLSDNPSEIFELSAKLCEYNIARQVDCDELYRSAKEKLQKKGAYKRIIILEDASWKNGLVGIAAAKLVEEYNRPVIMFVNKDGVLHGSARSVEGINILDAITANKQFLTEFGGHSQAAGVTLDIENLQAFEDGMNDYLSEKYPSDVFIPKQEVEEYVDEVFTLSFARELMQLEPFGTGNKRPLFALECDAVEPRQLKDGSPHIAFSTGVIDLIYFNGEKESSLLRAPVKKTVVFEPNISYYGGKESLRGFVKCYEAEVEPNGELSADLFTANLSNIAADGCPAEVTMLTKEQTDELIERENTCPYGTMYVVSSLKTLEFFPQIKSLPLYLSYPRVKNLGNCVVAVLSENGAEGFRNIVYLDEPMYTPVKVGSAAIYVNGGIRASEFLPDLNPTREGVGEVFSIVKNMNGKRAYTPSDLYFIIKEDAYISRYQLIFGVKVLEELGIIVFKNGKIEYDRTVRADLNKSKIFKTIEGLKNN